MKVSAKKPVGFYAKAAKAFLHGTEDVEPVSELTISALGDAITIAVAVAVRVEQDGLASIKCVQTDYPEMVSSRCAHITICLVNSEENLKAGSEVRERNKVLHARLAEVLTQGCDDRIIVNPQTGMHKYNGTNCPVPGSVRRSSCTFNVPTDDMFQVGVAALRRLDGNPAQVEVLRQECCDRMRKVWSVSRGEAITMFPSGTDAEFLPMLLAVARALKSGAGGKVVSIITCAGEVGSGTTSAATGLHFAPLQATNTTHKPGTSIFASGKIPCVDAVELKLRNAEGMRHEFDALDNIVREAVEKAIEVDGYSVAVVHMVVGSKTGRLMPSVDLMKSLSTKFGKKVLLVADACQVRMADHGLEDLLTSDFAVLVTGSKFYGGPPFCGAALLPADMAEELNAALASADVGGELHSLVQGSTLRDYISASLVAPELPNLKALLPEASPNLGLLLRWHMSLHYIEAFHKIPSEKRDQICTRWMQQTNDLIRAKSFKTISSREDPSSSAGDGQKRLRRRNTTMIREDAHMMPFLTIVLLELSKSIANGENVPLSLGELKKMHTLMATDLSGDTGLPTNGVSARRFFLAQPVTLSSSVHVLRMAIGAPLVTRLHRSDRQGVGDKEFDEVRQEDEALFEKMDLLLCNYFVQSP